MILLDTNALLFWTLDSKALSKKAADAIADAETVSISSISIWEIGIKVKRGKLTIPLTIREYAAQLNLLEGFKILPVDEAAWMKNIELDWENRDPADRTIVATAEILSCPLVSSDITVRSFYPNTIW
ncbi:MAG: PIN domain-containing protein [Desulfobacteraceae bacterium]|nr:MAG: PIN domain-containing protein [Desulfobacteraceae bacterium]